MLHYREFFEKKNTLISKCIFRLKYSKFVVFKPFATCRIGKFKLAGKMYENYISQIRLDSQVQHFTYEANLNDQ